MKAKALLLSAFLVLMLVISITPLSVNGSILNSADIVVGADIKTCKQEATKIILEVIKPIVVQNRNSQLSCEDFRVKTNKYYIFGEYLLGVESATDLEIHREQIIKLQLMNLLLFVLLTGFFVSVFYRPNTWE